MKRLLLFALFFLIAIPAQAQQKKGRGRIAPDPEVTKQRHRISEQRFGKILRALPPATDTKYNAAALGLTPPIGDQGSCGDCYIWSGTYVCSVAQIVAGVVPKSTAFYLSPQYFLDCQNVGGCGGGDEYQVASIIQQTGCPSAQAYGGAGQNPGRCQSTAGMTLYTVASLAYCTNSSGVANTQDIKNCIKAYGYVSVAVDASAFDNYQPGTILQGNGNSIDHAVGLVGWDDTTSPPCWILQNQWGTSWGNNGFMQIAYGSYSVGTEAFVAIVTPVTPPPTPSGAPTITSLTTWSIQVGVASTYNITATNSPIAYGAAGLPAGFTISSTTGQITGTAAAAGASQVIISATNASGVGTATISIVAGTTPPPSPGGVTVFTMTGPNINPAGPNVVNGTLTLEGVPVGFNAAFQQAMSLLQNAKPATSKEPPLLTPDPGYEKRFAEIEKRQADIQQSLVVITDAVLNLKKIVEGNSKSKETVK